MPAEEMIGSRSMMMADRLARSLWVGWWDARSWVGGMLVGRVRALSAVLSQCVLPHFPCLSFSRVWELRAPGDDDGDALPAKQSGDPDPDARRADVAPGRWPSKL